MRRALDSGREGGGSAADWADGPRESGESKSDSSLSTPAHGDGRGLGRIVRRRREERMDRATAALDGRLFDDRADAQMERRRGEESPRRGHSMGSARTAPRPRCTSRASKRGSGDGAEIGREGDSDGVQAAGCRRRGRRRRAWGESRGRDGTPECRTWSRRMRGGWYAGTGNRVEGFEAASWDVCGLG